MAPHDKPGASRRRSQPAAPGSLSTSGGARPFGPGAQGAGVPSPTAPLHSGALMEGGREAPAGSRKTLYGASAPALVLWEGDIFGQGKGGREWEGWGSRS